MNVMRNWRPKKGDKRSMRIERWHREPKRNIEVLDETAPARGRRRKRG